MGGLANDPFIQGAAQVGGQEAVDDVARATGNQTTGERLGDLNRAYNDRDDLFRREPQYKDVDKKVGKENPWSFPTEDANKYKVPVKDWLDKTPEERKRYRDEDWKKNPFNTSGDKWDWAPWNQGKNPNSLHPNPQTDNNDFSGESETMPFDFPPGTGSFQFSVTVNSKISVYGTPGGQTSASYQNSYDSGSERYYVGVPEYLRVQRLANTGYSVWIKLRGQPEKNVHGVELGPVQPQASYSTAAGPQVKVKAFDDAQRLPWPRTEDAPIPQSEQLPQPQLEPLAPPQYQPTGYPELPIPQFPYPSPQPLPNLRPSPAPNLRPSPYRDPAKQPTPFPKPTVDPTAPPTTQPNPFPLPFPSIQPTPNPGPQVRPQPQPNSRTTSFPAPNATPGNLEIPDFLKSYETVQSFDPGLPAPESDLCKDPCIKSMHDTSKGQKPKEISYKIFKKCGDNGAEFETKTLSVPADQADALKILLDDAADRKAEKCTTEENTLTIPEWWAVRPGADRPQMVILYAEVFSSGKLGNGRWQLTIPHYNRPKGAKPQIPTYQKGNWMGTLTLTDNSKIRVNAASASECRMVINKLKILIPVQYRTANGKAIKPTILQREDGTLKEVKVMPVRGDFYATGQRSQAPDWTVNFRK